MRIIRFAAAGQPAAIGLLFGDKGRTRLGLADAPTGVNALIEDWDRIAPKLAGAADATGLALSEVSLLAPVNNPRKLLAIGLNHADHIEETRHLGLTTPENQTWFCKLPTARNGPFGAIERPRV